MIKPEDALPDVRDGSLKRTTAMLWGRVCEHFYTSPEDLSELARLGAGK